MTTALPIWSDSLLDDWLPTQPEYRELADDPAAFNAFCQDATTRMAPVAAGAAPSEAVTREDVILPLLRALGWEHTLTEQSLHDGGTPDRMLFADGAARQRAADSNNPVAHAVGLTECKAWGRNLDQRGSGTLGRESPARQAQRYLVHAHPDSGGQVRWAMLTNGARWRLYSYDARPRSRYWEVDFTQLLQLGQQASLFAAAADTDDADTTHRLRVAYLVLRRASWTPAADERESLLDRLLAEGRRAEAELSDDLSAVVFERVYPQLVEYLWQSEPDAAPAEVASAAQTLLYRLLFIFYAEDRGMLPVEESPYRDNSARHALRDHINERWNDQSFSTTFTSYWDSVLQLSRVIDRGDESISIPEYNGGLFADYRQPLLSRIKLSNQQMAEIVHPLSYRGEQYINYRDLAIQQLGGIYERLLERLPMRRGGEIDIILQPYARKDSGSYYTPQELVDLIVERTLTPLVEERIEAFRQDPREANDPAVAVLELRVLDPAMGSGHFLLTAIDWLTEQLSELIEREWPEAPGYVSPIRARVWQLQEQHPELSDEALLRRMALKRCIFGVDKNPMAVELAKVALWLHSFSGDLPLPFLEHRLLCGDSLLGIGADSAAAFFNRYAPERFGDRFPADIEHVLGLYRDAAPQLAEPLDLDAAEVHAAGAKLDELNSLFERARRPLHLIAGLRMLSADMKQRERDTWLEPLRETFREGNRRATAILYNGENQADRTPTTPEYRQLRDAANEVAAQERLLHWEIAFPEVMSEGGFDAVIGNPPWDRIKLQEVEWWAARDLDVARARTAAERKRVIATRRALDDPMVRDFDRAAEQAQQLSALIRTNGDYPLLGRGDINLYCLFVERALALLKPNGVSGLLTPSGIYADKTAAEFFRSVSTTGRLAGIYDFENRRTANPEAKTAKWFPDVHPQFKFCATIIGAAERRFEDAHCGFFLDGQSDLEDEERVFPLAPDDFQRINPNTATAPILRSRADADLVTRIYEEHPVLVDRSSGEERRLYPVRYHTMFHMTNDSHLFKSAKELDDFGTYHVEGNRYRKGTEEWAPLYQGRMIHHYDHRANQVEISPDSTHNPYVSKVVAEKEHQDPKFFPGVQYWVEVSEVAKQLSPKQTWVVAFRDIARATDERTMISTIAPWSAFGNTAALLLPSGMFTAIEATCMTATFSSLTLDYVSKIKFQGTHANWFIVEQLPMIHPDAFSQTFGDTTARDIVRDHVLRLTYTAWDMQPFARDLGYDGDPLIWDAAERRQLRARLDALFFHLYGLSEPETTYVLDQFPVLEKNEQRQFNRYLTKHLVIGHYRALQAGDTKSEISE